MPIQTYQNKEIYMYLPIYKWKYPYKQTYINIASFHNPLQIKRQMLSDIVEVAILSMSIFIFYFFLHWYIKAIKNERELRHMLNVLIFIDVQMCLFGLFFIILNKKLLKKFPSFTYFLKRTLFVNIFLLKKESSISSDYSTKWHNFKKKFDHYY